MGKAVLAGMFAFAASASLAQTTADPADAGGPANLCQELLAYAKAPPAESATPAPPAKTAEKEPAEEGVAPEAKTVDAEPAPGGESESSQEVTNQSGVATEAPDPDAPGANEGGTAEDAPQKNSMSAPVPTDGESVSKESVISVAEAEELAAANDIAACKTAVRELRLAGVAVPPPLLALGALDLQYQSTELEAPASGTSPASQPEAD